MYGSWLQDSSETDSLNALVGPWKGVGREHLNIYWQAGYRRGGRLLPFQTPHRGSAPAFHSRGRADAIEFPSLKRLAIL